jgi:HEAT repeat protein
LIADESRELRRVGLWALGFVEEPGDVDILAAVATDPDPEIRSVAIGSIPDPARDDRAFHVIVRALHDFVEEVRVSAVSRLGYSGRSDAVVPVAAAGDVAPHVRTMAAYALGRLKRAEAVPTLLRLLDDPDRHVRERAVEALGVIGGPAAVDALTALGGDPDPQVRTQAAKALPQAAGSDPRVTVRITELARDPEPSVRAATLSGLATAGGSTWAPIVTELANDPSPEVRQRVAVVARLIAPDDVRNILRGYADDHDPTVRRIATVELDRLTGP